MLAVFLQAFVVQTHVHTPTAPLQLSYAQPAGATDDAQAHARATNTHHQILCVICLTMAASGSATLPASAIVTATTQTNGEALVAIALAPRVHSHSWRSRAPPSFL
ncbi:MAG: hypothetical protein IPG56_03300 [Caulobacteraceae bacterium]|nr:hypothetical protein [Caulobacteraceae bacterium]